MGFVYAALAVALSHSLNDFLVLCSFLFAFYADELSTEFVRLREAHGAERRAQSEVYRAERWLHISRLMGGLMEPHRRHIYQLLANEMGIDHWKVSVGYGVLQAVVGVGALLVRGFGTGAVIGYLGAWFVAFWIFGSWVRRQTAGETE